MRKDFGAKPWAYPMPVFILASYDEAGVPDAMNAAWGGMIGENQIVFSVNPHHKTAANIKARKAFTVSMGTASYLLDCDYVGIVSANNQPNKLQNTHFHTVPSSKVDAPIIQELPMTLECRLISYDAETSQLLGEIVNVSADESILDDAGKIDPCKLDPIIFDPVNHGYHRLGERIGNAFKDGQKLK